MHFVRGKIVKLYSNVTGDAILEIETGIFQRTIIYAPYDIWKQVRTYIGYPDEYLKKKSPAYFFEYTFNGDEKVLTGVSAVYIYGD